VVVGLTIKALLHIRLFNVSTGPGSSFPVGVEMIVQLFEPWMLRRLVLDHWNKLQTFVKPRAAALATPAAAQAQALANIPGGTKSADRAAFTADIGIASTQSEVIIVYVKYFGIAAAKLVFP